MAFIEITTNNLSRELGNSKAAIDNWVYVPGTAITGDWTKPVLVTTVDEFKNAFGQKGPEGSSTFEYVTGLLSAGMPIMFRRIAHHNQANITEEDVENDLNGALKAKATFKKETDTGEIIDFIVEEKYGGSFGNDMKVTYKPSTSAIWLDVEVGRSLIERRRLAIRKANSEETAKEVINSLRTIEFDRIKISSVNEDFTTFDVNEKKEFMLVGGADFPETDVAAEIPESYKFIEDKMLFKPKFITSGGYTDDMSNGKGPLAIANAMLALTKKRQDCAAIIDLPIGSVQGEYEYVAGSLKYNQYTDNGIIASGRIFGPWVYIRIGADSYWMPPSYAYLTAMGNRLAEGKKSYNPVAGLSTGVIKNVVRTEFEIGTDIAEKWQSDDSVNINPIMKINGSTYAIGGNSTLLEPEVETGENNLFIESSADLTVIDIRRFVYNLATELQFQYNSTEVFETFGLRTSDYLDRMISEGAVTDYAIYNESTDAEPRKLKIRLDVYLSPTVKKIEILLNVGYGSVEMQTEGGNS